MEYYYRYSSEIRPFKAVIIFFILSSVTMLETSYAQALSAVNYITGADTDAGKNGTNLLNLTDPRKACPLDPSQPGCLLYSEPKPNISEIYKLEQQTKH